MGLVGLFGSWSNYISRKTRHYYHFVVTRVNTVCQNSDFASYRAHKTYVYPCSCQSAAILGHQRVLSGCLGVGLTISIEKPDTSIILWCLRPIPQVNIAISLYTECVRHRTMLIAPKVQLPGGTNGSCRVA